MKDFIDNFYSYDFTDILHNDESSRDSDIEIDLESVDVAEDDEEEADKTKHVSPVVEKEITNTWIQQEAACIVLSSGESRKTKNLKFLIRFFLFCYLFPSCFSANEMPEELANVFGSNQKHC